MRLDITWRNIEASEFITERADRKIAKVATHLREPMEAHLVLRQEKHRFDVELTLNAPGFHNVVARDTSDDIVVSLDAVMAKLERTARRHRERLLDSERQPTEEVPIPAR